jgi:hypothetical protein
MPMSARCALVLRFLLISRLCRGTNSVLLLVSSALTWCDLGSGQAREAQIGHVDIRSGTRVTLVQALKDETVESRLNYWDS